MMHSDIDFKHKNTDAKKQTNIKEFLYRFVNIYLTLSDHKHEYILNI